MYYYVLNFNFSSLKFLISSAGDQCLLQCCDNDLCNDGCQKAPVTKPSSVSMTTDIPLVCLSNPCVFGQCIQAENTYYCNCKEDYYGRNCEKHLTSPLTSTTKMTSSTTEAATPIQISTTTPTKPSTHAHSVVFSSQANCMLFCSITVGHCSYENGDYLCICKTGFHGPYCQYEGDISSTASSSSSCNFYPCGN